MRANIIVLTISILVLSAGCNTTQPSTPLPASANTISTQTQQIINTPISIPLPTQTPALLPSPTKEKADQVIVSPNGALVAKHYDEYSDSLDGEKIVIQNSDGLLVREIPFEGVILGADGNVAWEIPAQGEIWTIDPHPGIHILKWSLDNQYLYFYYSMFFDGSHAFFMGYDLQQINIETGVVEKILPGNGLMAFSFSPNQEYLAYVRSQDEPRRIIIRNTKTGIENEIVINIELGTELQVGWFRWSPYLENELLYYVLKNEWLQLYYLDINSIIPKLLYEDWVEEFWFDDWFPENKLRLISYPDNEITEINIAYPTPVVIGTATPSP